jgi:glycosyltransferase involved in cell wall biosynthesis
MSYVNKSLYLISSNHCPVRISLIITTFNWKEALELSVRSVFKQTSLPSEIIIADDGSDRHTRQVIETLQKNSPLPIVHSWQSNKGFRLSRSRNKALSIAKGDYIILIDGDIVIEKNFIADHIEAARDGYFIQGSRVLLNADSTKQALDKKELTLCLTDPGVENRKNCIRSNLLSKLFSFSSKRLTGIKTCNFAFWRKHAETVNGFNEDFVGWGREDSEFSARMLNYGLKRRNLKFKAVTYHLYHKINSREHIAANDKILEDTLKNHLVWCQNGLNLHEKNRG